MTQISIIIIHDYQILHFFRFHNMNENPTVH